MFSVDKAQFVEQGWSKLKKRTLAYIPVTLANDNKTLMTARRPQQGTMRRYHTHFSLHPTPTEGIYIRR